jgi:type III secretion inner rod protein HrpB2
MDSTIAALHQYQSLVGQDATAVSPAAPAAPSQVSEDLVQKFQAMMAQTAPQAVGNSSSHTQNVLSKAVAEQAEDYRRVPNDVLYMTQNMSSVSMDRLMAADMNIQLEIASMNADLQVKMAAVQSSKDAVQTLMKNQ